MSNDNETEVEEVSEEVNETDNDTNSETEGDGEAQPETTNERKPEAPEAKRARLTRQLDQLNKKHPKEVTEESGEKASKETKEKKEVGSEERYNRLDLKFEGVKDKGEQDAILDYAEYKGLDIMDAMNSPVMKAELKEMRNKNATPSSSKRTSGGARDDVAYWAGQMKKGNRPPTAELRMKAREYLTKK